MLDELAQAISRHRINLRTAIGEPSTKINIRQKERLADLV
jgi:hypothetical protein